MPTFPNISQMPRSPAAADSQRSSTVTPPSLRAARAAPPKPAQTKLRSPVVASTPSLLGPTALALRISPLPDHAAASPEPLVPSDSAVDVSCEIAASVAAVAAPDARVAEIQSAICRDEARKDERDEQARQLLQDLEGLRRDQDRLDALMRMTEQRVAALQRMASQLTASLPPSMRRLMIESQIPVAGAACAAEPETAAMRPTARSPTPHGIIAVEKPSSDPQAKVEAHAQQQTRVLPATGPEQDSASQVATSPVLLRPSNTLTHEHASQLESYIDYLEGQLCAANEALAKTDKPGPLASTRSHAASTPVAKFKPAVVLDAEIFGIGMNDDGQLGINNDEAKGGRPCTKLFRRMVTRLEKPKPQPVSGIPTKNHAIKIAQRNAVSSGSGSVGASASCAVVKVACGSMFSTSITADGRVWSWGFHECNGRGSHPVLPMDAPSDACPAEIEWIPSPVKFPISGVRAVDIACGEYMVGIVDSCGRVWTWGAARDKDGQRLCHAGPGVATQPAQIRLFGDAATRAVSISAGESHFVVRTASGAVYTWGLGQFGQLGRPFRPSRVYQAPFADLAPPAACQSGSPARVVLPRGFKTAHAVACGFSTFILGANRGVLACGKNGYGELGLGDSDQRVHLVPIPAFKNTRIIAVAGGLHHTLFLDSSGRVWGAGRNTYGQLGLGDVEAILEPKLIPGLSKIRHISCGTSSNHSYAIDSNGNLFSCGQGDYGQLGHKNENDYNAFTQVPLKQRRALRVAGGSHFTIAAIEPRKDAAA
ncbi:hypothetical protein HK105_208369 [Polyrhizophydium stewartii]|uniref:RCC1-like domain-containing protein n=1 Tax=Polyrhizophydium stewartii TaxID=2732419 RepID=A0ABR4MY23_9FUNG